MVCVNSDRLLWPTRVWFQPASRAGLSLIETIIVIGIIGLGLGLVLPAVQRVRDAAARAACASQIRQLALAVHLYSDAHQRLPQGCEYPFLKSLQDLKRQSGLSWHTSILPYIEQTELWSRAWQAQVQDPVGLSAGHAAIEAIAVPVFMCPADSRHFGVNYNGRVWAMTSYRGVAGTSIRRDDGIFHRNFTVRFADVTDGTSNTLMIGERPSGPNGIYSGWFAGWGACVCPLSQILPAGRTPWIPNEGVSCNPADTSFYPGQLNDPCDVNHFWSIHSGGANFAFVDGSVHFLSYSAASIMPLLATRAGGEEVEFP